MSKIGIMDSGVGGYSIARAIHKTSEVDIVFLADQYYVPYGEKKREELLEILKSNMKWFQKKGITEILIACNTASTLIEDLRIAFPELKLYGVIDITAQQFVEKSLEELLVLGTRLTIESGFYQKLLKRYLPKTNLYFEKCPELAEMIENNVSFEETCDYFEAHLETYTGRNVPILLACTHYPIIAEAFKTYFGSVTYDSIGSCQQLFETYEGSNDFEVYTSGDTNYLDQQVNILFADKIVSLKKFI